MAPPKKGKKGEGLHSAAGLIRYFDAEDEVAIKIHPYAVMILSIVMVVMIEVARWKWPV